MRQRWWLNKWLILSVVVIVIAGSIPVGMLTWKYRHHFMKPKPLRYPPTSKPTEDLAAKLELHTDLQLRITEAKNGDRIVLPPGRYTGGANFDGKNNITVEAKTPGTVYLEGGQVLGGEKITLRNLVIQKVVTPLQVGAVVTGPDWVMEDCVVRDNESLGVSCSGARSILRRVKSIRNGYMGFGCGTDDGKPFPGPKLYDCESAYNNTGRENPSWKTQEQAVYHNGLYYISPSWEAGGGKFCCCDGLVIERMKAHDNGGPGVWLDVYNQAVTIKDSESYNNCGVTANWEGVGFAVEISSGPTLIENCYAHDNTGSGYAIWESRNLTIHNCVASGTGVELRDIGGDRGAAGWFCRNIELDSIRFYGDADVSYWSNQTSSWRESYHIIEKNLQYLKGPPQWQPSPGIQQ